MEMCADKMYSSTHREWWAALSVSVWWVISRAKARIEWIITSGIVAECITWLGDMSINHKLYGRLGKNIMAKLFSKSQGQAVFSTPRRGIFLNQFGNDSSDWGVPKAGRRNLAEHGCHAFYSSWTWSIKHATFPTPLYKYEASSVEWSRPWSGRWNRSAGIGNQFPLRMWEPKSSHEGVS